MVAVNLEQVKGVLQLEGTGQQMMQFVGEGQETDWCLQGAEEEQGKKEKDRKGKGEERGGKKGIIQNSFTIVAPIQCSN